MKTLDLMLFITLFITIIGIGIIAVAEMIIEFIKDRKKRK